MAARCQRTRGGISLFCKKEENYESDTGDETNLDQASNNKNSLQLWEEEVGKRYKQRYNWVLLHIYKNLACLVIIYSLFILAQLPKTWLNFLADFLLTGCVSCLYFSPMAIYPHQDLQPLLPSHLSWKAIL